MTTRANLYGKAQIVMGDRTSHGGVVISGSRTASWHGIPVARKTDRVYCLKCRPHIFEIAEGLKNCTDAELPMATEGHPTTCGAVLIADAATTSLRNAVLQFCGNEGYDDFYVLRDCDGRPMPGTYYGACRAGGEVEYGTTDDAGRTHICLTGENADQISFYIAG